MIGRTLGNRYEIIERIGGGGMAVVYRAKCHLLNRFVAVKVLREEFTNNEDFINRFNRESQSAASLTHSNIVGIYDVGSEDNIHYIVMEYVKGRTLKQLIKKKGKLLPKETIRISLQIAEALNTAHKNNIVHRDIKPHNIMINEEGDIKVTDFGIARAATSSTVTVTSSVIGSVHYFSPEQARGGYTDAKSDLYSLGIVMYEMLTGKVPFQGESPISVALKHIREDIVPLCEVDSTIPKALEMIVTKAVQKDQALRYDSAEEIIKDLKKADLNMQDDTIKFKNYDDSPTMVIPKDEVIAQNNKFEDTLVKTEPKKEEEDKVPKRRRNVQAKQKTKKKKVAKKQEETKGNKLVVGVVAVFSALLIVCALAFGYFYVKDVFVKDEVVMPKLYGLDQAEAKRQIENLGLKFVVSKEEYNDSYSKGKVISQSEKTGSTLKEGFTVAVKISKGVKMIEVPDLLNKESNEAEALLNNKGLEEGEVGHDFSDLPRNIVVSQTPKAGEMVKAGTKVSYVISNGQEVEYAIMAKYIGKNVEAAKKELVNNGFKIGETKYEPSNNAAKGVVIGQSFPPGTSVELKTAVDFTVSNGNSIPVIADNNSGNTGGDTGSNGEEGDTKPKPKIHNISIQLPTDRESVEITVYKIVGEEKELVYKRSVLTSEGGVQVPVVGVGYTKFEIYFDGEFIAPFEYTF